jgi:hypothetical protein
MFEKSATKRESVSVGGGRRGREGKFQRLDDGFDELALFVV